jgi:hypothetical protein
MEMSRHVHASATLTPKRNLRYPLDERGWCSEPVWALWSRQSCSPCRESNHDFEVIQPIAVVPTELHLFQTYHNFLRCVMLLHHMASYSNIIILVDFILVDPVAPPHFYFMSGEDSDESHVTLSVFCRKFTPVNWHSPAQNSDSVHRDAQYFDVTRMTQRGARRKITLRYISEK